MIPGVIHSKSQHALSEAVFNYYNFKKEDRNLVQSKYDGLVHHHFGLTGTKINDDASQDQITEEIQRQETAQTQIMIDLLGLNKDETAAVYDVGCGRGGTMLSILEQYPLSNVSGINLTEYQTQFCNEEINRRNLNFRAVVHQGNFLKTNFINESFSHAIVNEVTPYADNLDDFFSELSRTLKKDSKVVLSTWCFNDNKNTTDFWKFLTPICVHYASSMHGINEYKKAISKNFNLVQELNFNADIIDYWVLRKKWVLQSGVEQFFLDAHLNNDMHYMIFVLEKR